MPRICADTAALLLDAAACAELSNRPIRFVVPLAAAGAGDIVARTVAAKLAEMWGQQIVIDNRPGANTIIGTDLVAKVQAGRLHVAAGRAGQSRHQSGDVSEPARTTRKKISIRSRR